MEAKVHGFLRSFSLVFHVRENVGLQKVIPAAVWFFFFWSIHPKCVSTFR